MRTYLAVCVAAGLALAPMVAAAEDVETLRREIEQLRQRLEETQRQYRTAIDQMTERVQRLEARPRLAATGASRAEGERALPGLLDLARPREPFALYGQAQPGAPGAPAPSVGRGQFLFDMGIAGDFIGNYASSAAEKTHTGTFAGRENRVFPREIEVSLFGQVDPFARGEVRVEAAEEFEKGERSLGVSLAEAHLTLLTLPLGLQLKGGLMRSRFGLLNELHMHDRPQPDSPSVLTRFFGEEGLRESGVELRWVPPLPVYLEAILGVFNGDNEDAFGRGSLRDPLLTARIRTFFELGDLGGLQLGLSGAHGVSEARKRASYLGLDAKYKYSPSGFSHPLLTVGGEVLFAHRKIASEAEDSGAGVEPLARRLRQESGEPAEPSPAEFRTRDSHGYYVWAEVQPWKRWAFGARYDWTELPSEPGREWAIEPYVAFMPSEFLRFRLGYKHTDRSGFETGPTTLEELFLQATFILGAHPAHPF